MTFQELLADIRLAVQEQYGPGPSPDGQEQYPDKYFNPNVYVTDPTGKTTTPRAQRYCATIFGAASLISALNTPNNVAPYPPAIRLTLSNAMNYGIGLLDGWTDSEPVPYIVFKFNNDEGDQRVVNAGLLLDYCNHGEPMNIVIQKLSQEINSSTTPV